MRIKLHDTLCIDFWEKNKLKSDIKSNLLKIAEDFINTLKIKESPDDITLTGSIANFNYTTTSDIDLHVLYDLAHVQCDEELTKDYVIAKKSLWNDKHDITIYNRPVELYVQDVHEPHISTGVYSVIRDVWLSRPSLEQIDVDERLVSKKVQEYADIIDHNISKNTNPNLLKKLRQRIGDMRKSGLSESGQYSIENLVFKELRRQGYLDRLADHEISSYDKSMSMESFASFYKSQNI